MTFLYFYDLNVITDFVIPSIQSMTNCRDASGFQNLGEQNIQNTKFRKILQPHNF